MLTQKHTAERVEATLSDSGAYVLPSQINTILFKPKCLPWKVPWPLLTNGRLQPQTPLCIPYTDIQDQLCLSAPLPCLQMFSEGRLLLPRKAGQGFTHLTWDLKGRIGACWVDRGESLGSPTRKKGEHTKAKRRE